MYKKDFKLLIEGFDKFLLNEHIGHTDKCIELFKKIEKDYPEFKDYISDKFSWYSAEAWLSDTYDGTGPQADQERQDAEDYYRNVARECGCDYEDLLIGDIDGLSEEWGDMGVDHGPFTRSYTQTGGLCGEFDLGGKKLKGSETIGEIFIAPCDSVTSVLSDDEPEESEQSGFKSELGGVWG